MVGKSEFIERVVGLSNGGTIIYYGYQHQYRDVALDYGSRGRVFICDATKFEHIRYEKTLWSKLGFSKGKKVVSSSGGVYNCFGVKAAGILLHSEDTLSWDDFLVLITRLRYQGVDEYVIGDVYNKRLYKIPKDAYPDIKVLYRQITGRGGSDENYSSN